MRRDDRRVLDDGVAERLGELAIAGRDLVFAAIASTAALLGTIVLGPRWLAAGFDPSAERATNRWWDGR